jgi:co-chaperonin GroES (HSP10)
MSGNDTLPFEPFRWTADPVTEFKYATVGIPLPAEANNHPCGLDPVEFNVIIEQDAVEEVTKGGLHLPTQTQEKEKNMATRGTIVAVSPLAFTYDEWPEGSRKPGVGARVAFVQHAGAFIEGRDGKKYRVVKDKDIVAVLR